MLSAIFCRLAAVRQVFKCCVTPTIIMSCRFNLLSAILNTLGQDSCSKLSNVKLSGEIVPGRIVREEKISDERLDALLAGA